MIINSLFSALPKTRMMTHYTVHFNSAIPKVATVSSLEQNLLQGTLEDWPATH